MQASFGAEIFGPSDYTLEYIRNRRIDTFHPLRFVPKAQQLLYIYIPNYCIRKPILVLIVYVANPSRTAGARPRRHVITAWWGMLVGEVAAAASPGTAGEGNGDPQRIIRTFIS